MIFGIWVSSFKKNRDHEGSGRYEKVLFDAAKLVDVQIEDQKGRPPIASSACDSLRYIVYLPFLDFILVTSRNDPLVQLLHVSKCASCPVGYPRKMQEHFDYLVRLYESVLPEGISPASSKLEKTCGASRCTPIHQKTSELPSECITNPKCQ